ncbi:MAG: CBS domain-containing protein [Clostridia bacterium]|nr:CBS domain-containing protein [Clostridia bacterium]MBQ8924972.1 CBS domain-containing protein [Clostridia bacterium]
MAGTEKFIALCKELESAVKARYGGTSHGESVYVFLARRAEFKPYVKELDLIREVRNLIQHKDVEVKGKEAIYVDEVLMDALREIIGLVQHPETVGDICTRDLMTAGLSTPVKEVIDRMLDSSFSHIPVLDEQGKLLGIFSENTIFTRVAKEGLGALTESDCVRDFKPYLDIRDHVRDSFAFIAEGVATEQAVEQFKHRDKQGRRLAMLVVTRHGDPSEKVLGVLTPYDVLE